MSRRTGPESTRLFPRNWKRQRLNPRLLVVVDREHGRISNSRHVLALPSRDFRISLWRVRIPGANEERSGTLVAARRKKKEAPRPRYVAGTQTGVLVPTSIRIHPRESVCPCTSRVQVLPALPLSRPSVPSRTPFAYLVYTGGTNATTSSNWSLGEKEMRGLTSILTALLSLSSPLFFPSYSSESKGKEEEEEEKEEEEENGGREPVGKCEGRSPGGNDKAVVTRRRGGDEEREEKMEESEG